MSDTDDAVAGDPATATPTAESSGPSASLAGAAGPGEPVAPSSEPAGPAPLGVVRTPTGHAAVDARLERLADADHLPADGHVEVYEDVHRGLRAELTSLDARPAAAAPGPVPTPSHRTQDTRHDTRHDNRS
ncbi:hypothetical protein [Streptomyces sp. V2I9]|uniref:hypothetical protein n=1 Tax=Streptomyces sp. V2I9 TaxID=3042304 RepID=UPI002785DBFD|nr:hypothetical protein [Streptomyces sp. V2I9]MDQ0983704.1 hypothetical protein [Streptomyces sp. V2I9]